MAETYLDNPGDVKWFSGHGPARVIGPCEHDCPHNMLSTVAWGPDFEHYELNICDVPDGCNGSCRAWSRGYPPPFSADRPKFRLAAFLNVDAA